MIRGYIVGMVFVMCCILAWRCEDLDNLELSARGCTV